MNLRAADSRSVEEPPVDPGAIQKATVWGFWDIMACLLSVASAVISSLCDNKSVPVAPGRIAPWSRNAIPRRAANSTFIDFLRSCLILSHS